MLYLCTGMVTGNDFLAASTSLRASEERLKKLRYVVVDMTRMESLDLSFTDLKKIETNDRLTARINPDGVVAIVVDKDIPFNVVSAWDIRTPDISWEKRIFRTKDEAYDWVRTKVRDKFGEEIEVPAD
jgi:hypothetical protein